MTLTLERLVPEHARATVRLATTADQVGLTELFSRTSATSLSRRFLTGMAGPPPASLVRYLLLAGRPGAAYLALDGAEVVGHAMWVPVRAEEVGGRRVAEVALLVRDDHQGRGLGSALLRALGSCLGDAGIGWVRATTSSDNRIVTGMLRRRHPGVRPTRDGADLTYLVPTTPAT